MSRKAGLARHRWMLLLVICIPLASVAFGGLMFYVAANSTDTFVAESETPLSKTSWRTPSPAQSPGQGLSQGQGRDEP